ncbi:hypothetical protein B0T16DRAFT_249358 [Cercophora newfieldiana]|uniref:Uncharacterized protein n=1 Tax=Cercophora newfieldiana TaxID=92897 RepID=A0AA39XVM6_9PEZI|nr:hypothetical protein B0T16DRAFT_249358 [Cercophora newfieldiana]
MVTATIHRGPYLAIQKDASPGLVFLRQFLTASDSLSTDDHKVLCNQLHPDATFTINNNPAITLDQLLPMLAMRSTKVSKFGHDVHTAWDIAEDDGGRTLMYESTSFTVFKGDPESVEARVNEFGVIELSRCSGGELKATKLRTYMDPAPVSARARLAMGMMGQ